MILRHDLKLYDECPNKSTERTRWNRGEHSTETVEHDVAENQRLVSCWWCRGERGRRQRQHRKRPALPLAPGVCALCHGELTGRRRSWCSEGCVEVWMGAASGPIMLGHLVTLHGWFCWCCGVETEQLEVDHIRPLWSLTEDERTEPRWWLPFNLQLLCQRCHKAKTAREAGDRAAGRPPRAQPVEQLALT